MIDSFILSELIVSLFWEEIISLISAMGMYKRKTTEKENKATETIDTKAFPMGTCNVGLKSKRIKHTEKSTSLIIGNLNDVVSL